MKNKQYRELAVCGFEAVRALAEKHPEKIQRLFFNKDKARYFGDVCKTLAARKKPYKMVESDEELEKLTQSVHHQGVAAMIEEPVVPRLEMGTLEMWQREKARVLVLDRVGNANNFGAIVRSAAFFGITRIVIGEDDDQAQITTSAYRIAQGGMELVQVYRASSAAALVQASAGKMLRIGADHRAKRTLSDLRGMVGDSQGVLVVMGNEESGLSGEVRSSCDDLVKIPGTGEIESLNVAQAATLFLYELSLL